MKEMTFLKLNPEAHKKLKLFAVQNDLTLSGAIQKLIAERIQSPVLGRKEAEP
jgi:hypothetical protein